MRIEMLEENDQGRDWYQITGIDKNTGYEFNQDVFALKDGRLLDSDGYPLEPGDRFYQAISHTPLRIFLGD